MSKKRFGLEVNTFSKTKKWQVDQDYAHTLDDANKDWLSKFNQEYYKCHFEGGEESLHSTPELRKSCYSADNASRRCILGLKDAIGSIDRIEVSNDGVEVSVLDKVADYDYELVEFEELDLSKKKTTKKTKGQK